MKRCLVIPALVLAACSCAPRQPVDAGVILRFERWMARSGVTEVHGPVRCDLPNVPCGSIGLYDQAARTVTIDPVVAAKGQEIQDRIDPSVEVFTEVRYHEWAHAADAAAGFVFGAEPIRLEWAAQCGRELVRGFAWVPSFANAAIYFDCPDDMLEQVRQAWERAGII